MSVTKSVAESRISDLFLYQTQLAGIATVSVTHNAGCVSSTYAGNLGLHVQDDSSTVLQQRSTLEAALGKPIQWLNQVHGVLVCAATSDTLQDTPTADAAITSESGIALAVMTADCLPVVISACNAAGNRAVGIAHAGWRGLLAGVVTQTVAALHSRVPNATIHAHLGPCIGVAQFEVGSEVRDTFLAQANMAGGLNKAQRHFTLKANGNSGNNRKYLCDLESLARDALIEMGAQSIMGGGWCTVSDTRLASYRRQALTGRFATLVALN
jgi:YfiH family protein